MAWLGEGFSSLKGQITNFAKGVLSEDGETPQGERRKLSTGARTSHVETPSTSSNQSWDQVLDSADKFLGQDAPNEGLHPWTDPGISQSKDEKTETSKDSAQEKEVVSMIPRGLANFFQLNQNEQGAEILPKTGETLAHNATDKGVQTDVVTENHDKEARLRALEEANQMLVNQNATLSSNVATLNRMIQDLESQVAVSQDENANLSTGLEELDIQHQQAIEQILVVKEETHKQYEALKVRFAELTESYENVIKQQELSSAEKAPISEASQNAQPRDQEEYKEFLLKELKSRDKDLEVLEEENASLQNLVKELTGQIDKYNKNLPPIIENNEEMEIVEQKLHSLENEVIILGQVRCNLETELNRSKTRIDELVRSVQMSEAMLKNQENMQAEIDNMNLRNSQFKDEIEQLKSRNNDMKLSYENHNKTLQAHVDGELAQKQSSINNLKEELETKIEMLQSKEQEVEKLGRESAALNKKVSNMKTQLQNYDEQLDNIQKECESKDRKMCEILLESTAVEEEFKLFKETADRKYAFLVTEFEAMKQNIQKKDENHSSIERLKPDGVDFSEECLKAEVEDVQYELSKTEEQEEFRQKMERHLRKTLHDVESLKKELEDQIQEKESLMEEYQKKEEEMKKLNDEQPKVITELQDKIFTLEKELEGLNNISQEFEISKDISRQKEIEFKNQLHSREEELFRYKNSLRESELSKEKHIVSESELNEKLTEKENEIINLRKINNTLEKSVESEKMNIQNVNKQVEERNREIELLTAEIDSLSNKLTLLNGENFKIKSENASLLQENETKKAEQMKTDKKLVSENDDLREEIKNIQIINEEMKKKLQEFIGEREVFQEKLTSMEEKNKEKYDLLYRGKEKLEQELILEMSEMKSLYAQLEMKHFELTKSSQVKEAELSNFKSENQRLSALLKIEQEKSENILIEKIEFNNKYADLENQCKEKDDYMEQLEANNDRKVNALNQEIESLKTQLEYASQLLRVVDRQEAEGQPSADSSSQKSCPDGCDRTQKELTRLVETLLNEETRNKVLLGQLEEIAEKYSKAEGQLLTLKQHLVQVEDNYSGELVTARDKISELQARLAQADERVRSSSNAYTSASIRANQQVETLNVQVKILTDQNEKLEAELSKAEDTAHRQTAAITNLQAVLHQFQRDKQKDIDFETERIKQKLNDAYSKNDQLNGEIRQLQEQLNEAKKGLAAATRLSEQLDKKTEMITAMKERVLELEGKLSAEEEKLKAAFTTVEGKVDRCLVKNLLVGYICAPPRNKGQVLRVIGTVLDLNKEERQKVGLEAGLLPQQQSLSEAFIRFLETESQPKPQILLPLAQSESAGPSRKTSQSSTTSLLLTDDLPNLPHFTVGRNPGSILKDVLNDRNS